MAINNKIMATITIINNNEVRFINNKILPISLSIFFFKKYPNAIYRGIKINQILKALNFFKLYKYLSNKVNFKLSVKEASTGLSKPYLGKHI